MSLNNLNVPYIELDFLVKYWSDLETENSAGLEGVTSIILKYCKIW